MARALAQDCRAVQGGEWMKRKNRMEWYIERIYKVLQHLPVTQANEIECMALWNNLQLSHEDIVTRYIDKEPK